MNKLHICDECGGPTPDRGRGAATWAIARFCSRACAVAGRRPHTIEQWLEKFLPVRGEGCWEWTGSRIRFGYGSIWRPNKGHLLAHRAMWEFVNGPIPAGMEICHRCDNPPCCNPDHLFLGTHAQNMADMVVKGRHVSNPARGEAVGGVRLTEEKVRELRARVRAGETRLRLAKEFGVSRFAVRAAVARITWKHVLDE